MLPLVGFVAIGLLLVAGKLFFYSGDAESKRPLPVISPVSSSSSVPSEEQSHGTSVVPSSQKEGGPSVASPEPSVFAPRPALEGVETVQGAKPVAFLDVLAVPLQEKKPEAEKTAPPPKKTEAPKEAKVSVVTPKRALPKSAETPPPSRTQVPKSPAPPVQQPRPAPKIITVPVQQAPMWTVQIGAFSTREAAEAVSQQAGKSGYKAKIISGKTMHRVLLEAGTTRDDALSLATKLSKSGFQGAFIVPPR